MTEQSGQGAQRVALLTRWFPVLGAPRIRRYLMGQGASVFGQWVQIVTLNLMAWRLTASPALLGTLNFLMFGPTAVVAPIVGGHVQAHNARRITMGALAGSFCIALSLVALAAFHLASVPALLLIAAASGVLSGFELPARQVLLATSVDDRAHIANAVAMNTVMFNLARMTGPAAGAAVFAAAGPVWAFCITVCTLAFMLGCLRSLPDGNEMKGAAVHDGPRGLRAALAYVRADRVASLFLPVLACLAVLGGSYQTLVPVLADHVFGNAAAWSGWFFSAAGAGSLLAAVLLSSRHAPVSYRYLQVVTPWSVSVALLGLGLLHWMPAVLACFFVLGFALTFSGPGTNARLQQHAPAGLRGSLVGLYVMCFVGLMPVGQLLVGLLAEVLPVQGTFIAMALSMMVVLGGLFVPRWRALGRIELDGDRI